MNKINSIKIWDKHLRLYLKSASLLRPDNPGKIRLALFYFQKLFFAVSMFVFLIPVVLNSYYRPYLNIIIRSVVLAVSCFIALIIMWFWLLNGKKIEKFFNDILKSNEWTNGRKHLFCTCKSNFKYLRNMKMLFNFCLIEIVVTGNISHLLGFFNGTWEKREQLPYRATIFGNYYELSYFIQWISSFAMSTVITSKIEIIIYIFTYISFEFEVLANHFSNCIFEALINVGVPQKSVRLFNRCFINSYKSPDAISSNELPWIIVDQFRRKKFDRELSKILKTYVSRHQNLLSLNNEANNILMPLLVLFIGVSTLSNTIMIIYTFFEYDMVVVNTIFMINTSISIFFVIGEILSTKSDKVQEAIYNIPWYLCNPKSRKTILFILMQSQRPVSINIFWVKLNLATLLQLYNHFYVVITMLRPFILRRTY